MSLLTVDNLNDYATMCRTTQYKAVRFGGQHFIPSSLAQACEEIAKKLPFIVAGLGEISMAEKIFLELLQEEVDKI
jgi:hypothetical protein